MTHRANVQRCLLNLPLLAFLLAVHKSDAQPAGNRIENFRAVEISNAELRVFVDYFYAGGAKDVSIHAAPVRANGSLDPRDFSSEEKVLRTGGNTEEFVIRGKRRFTSAAINVCMSTLVDAILCKEFPYGKNWSATAEITGDAAPAPAELRIVSFDVSRPRISLGGSATLTWAVENAEVVLLGEPDPSSAELLSRARSVPARGSLVVEPTASTTYVLQSQRGDLQKRREVAVEVVPRIELSFDVPERVCAGRPFMVKWQVRHATDVTLNGRTVMEEGSLRVNDHRTNPRDHRYVLVARNEFESAEASRVIQTVPCPNGDD